MPERDPLSELLDRGRAEEQVSARAKERALRRMAEEDARLAGTLVDLAERGSVVAVRTEAGRTHHGVLVAVGGDYCVLRTDAGAEPHLRLSAIATVRPRPGERHPPAAGERSSSLDLRMLEVLAGVSPHRPEVTLVVRGGEVVSGQMVAVGVDVVTVRLAGAGREPCYVAAGAITEALIHP